MIAPESSTQASLPCSGEIEARVPTYHFAEKSRHPFLGAAARIGAVLTFVALGGAFGAEAGVREGTHRSTEFTLAPGLSAEARPILSDTAIVDTGTSGDLYASGLYVKEPYLGKLSVYLKPRSLSFSDESANVGVALINDPDKVFEQPLEKAITDHIEQDARQGALSGGVLGFGLGATILVSGSWRRRKKEEKRRTEFDQHSADYLASTHSHHENSSLQTSLHYQRCQDLARPPLKRHKGWKRFGASLAGLALSTSALSIGFNNMKPGAAHIDQTGLSQVDPSLVPQTDQLTGLAVTANSVLDLTLNKGLTELETVKNNIDDFYDLTATRVDRQLADWRADPANRVWLNNKRLIAMVFIDGTHCSVPFSSRLEPEIMKGFKPSIIVNLGNVDISTGSLPLESLCPGLTKYALQAAVDTTGRQVSELYALGSHDSMANTGVSEQAIQINGPSGKLYSPNIVLGYHNSGLVTVRGMTFVGGPTPRQNVDGQPTAVNGKAANLAVQNRALAINGDGLAKLACNNYVSNGVKPIGLANSREQLYKAQVDNCLNGAFSGEGPWQDSPFSYGDQFMAIEGSSAGNGVNCGFWPYEKISSLADVIYALGDPATNRIAAYAIMTIDPQGNVKLSQIKQPAAHPYDSSVIDNFLNTYDSGTTPPSHIPSDNSGPQC